MACRRDRHTPIRTAEQFYSDLRCDTTISKQDSKVVMLTFDFQQSLPLPHVPVGDWRAGASQPSRSTGTIFWYIYVYPGAAHTVMFYVLLNMR